MRRQPIIHVLADAGLSLALRQSLRGTASVAAWNDVPRLVTVSPGDLVVVDLDHVPTLALGALEPVARRATLLLVPGQKPIPPCWLEFATRQGVKVIASSSHAPRDHTPLLVEVLSRLRGPSGDQLARLVVEAEPMFKGLAHLVEAICTQPWRIRHPRDLASMTDVPLQQIRRSCWESGFKRVEHFIVCVRAVAYEQLLAVRVPRTVARARVGFADASNMRRHVARALRHSPLLAGSIRCGGDAAMA